MSAQHDEIQTKFLMAGRNGEYLLRSMADVASDEVAAFITKIDQRPTKVDRNWLQQTALQLHSDMFERVLKSVRQNEYGEIDIESVVTLSRSQEFAWKRIGGSIEAVAVYDDSRRFTLWNRLPQSFTFSGKFNLILDEMLAGLRDQSFGSVNDAATSCATKAENSTLTNAKGDGLIQMLNRDFKTGVKKHLKN